MKKVLSLFLCIVLCLLCAACAGGNGNPTDNSQPVSTALLNQKGIKVTFDSICPDGGIGEGINLVVENSRNDNINIHIVEVSLNGASQTVVQPQMPACITAAGSQSTQSFVFAGADQLSGKAQFKIKVLNENFGNILMTGFVEISF